MNHENGLTITIGCPGAGKSTWAEANLSPLTLRLERDRFRECIFGSRRAYHNSQIDRTVRSDVITAAMVAALEWWPNSSWAVTDTGLFYKSVEPFIDRAHNMDVPVKLVVFDRTIEYLMTCNRIRPHEHRIPEDTLLEMIAVYHGADAWWRSSPYETILVK